ncbi:transposase [Caldalkalibacillus uzonensis]|uniref:Transposase n=1 Tax=Caldalkalibacillus uzonensis TaxID=353224 RepID=A0ABU0CYI0_9BACI|nr:transposase [Caldalkalibacillus uzonensis]
MKKEMLEVVEINYIKHEVNRKDRSYASVAKQMGRDPRTVKKYADMEDFTPGPKPKQQRPSPVMDPVKPIIDEWLREDMKKKKKYRRTAKRMWQLLRRDYQFQGSARSVRHYVAQKKKELEEEQETALPLAAYPGTAQVDFGEAPFKRQGKIIDLPFLVLSFPYSNAFYVQVFESQNTECFLEGLKRIFHHMGGVPTTIRFDNLAPAVKKIHPNGQRELTDAFQRFVWHYGFEYEFCNPGSGHEKGHVEAMVKYIRHNFFLPEQAVEDPEFDSN